MPETVLIMTDRGLRLSDTSLLDVAPPAVEPPQASQIAEALRRVHPLPSRDGWIADCRKKIEDNPTSPNVSEWEQRISDCKFYPPVPTEETVLAAVKCLPEGAQVSLTRGITLKWTTPPVKCSFNERGSSGEIEFGRFECTVGLHGSEAGRMLPATARALDPNPCGWRPDYFHPHVEGQRICLGEGLRPLLKSLQAGDFDMAVGIVESLLNTYNPDSPYIHLDEWVARRVICACCGEAIVNEVDEDGELVNEAEAVRCDNCSATLCTECAEYCDGCDHSICPSHRVHCSRCDEDGCDRCCGACGGCGDGNHRDCMASCPCCSEPLCGNCIPSIG